MEFYTLASGSSGNCSLVCAGDTLLLSDAGISGRRIEQSLRALGRTLGDLTAVFITHEHTDHVKGCLLYTSTLFFEALALLRRAPALPADSVVDWAAGRLVPDKGGFALVGDANAAQLLG